MWPVNVTFNVCKYAEYEWYEKVHLFPLVTCKQN